MKLPQKISIALFIAFLSSSFLLAAFKPSQAQVDPKTKLSAELVERIEANPAQPISIIIRMEGASSEQIPFDRLPNAPLDRRALIVNTLKANAENSQKAILAVLQSLEDNNQVSGIRPFWIINGIGAEATSSAIVQLAKHPDVAQIDLNNQIHKIEPIEKIKVNDPRTLPIGEVHPEIYGLHHIKAPQVWHALGVTGTGVTVGILDSGTEYLHPALVENYRGRQQDGSFEHAGNWFHGAYPTTQTVPIDETGHGTHVAGIAVGRQGIGVAPGANWISASIADHDGKLLPSYIYAAFEWLLAPNGDPSLAPDIVNGSWGGPGYWTFFVDEVKLLQEAGIATVFSVGNDGPFTQTIGSPASYPNMIAAGASDQRGKPAFYSSRGPSPLHDEVGPVIVAPGSRIYSSFLGGTYEKFSGTSMSSPHVVGALALLHSTNHNLASYEEVREHLIKTAVPYPGEEHPNIVSGHGRLDAINLVKEFVPGLSRMSGILQSDSAPLPFTTIHVSNSSGSFAIETDINGHYSFDGKPGLYTLHIEKFGYATYDSGPLYLSSNHTIFNASVERLPYGTIFGRVVDAAGNPLTATVKVSTVGFEYEGQSAEDGTFSAEFPAGNYSVEIVKTGYTLGKANVLVEAGQSYERNFNLNETERILIIDAGEWSYRSRAEEYEDIFSELELGYDLLRLHEPIDDLPTLEEYQFYDTVIWSDPWYSPGYVGSSKVISQYLSTGGNILYTGARLAYFDLENLFDFEWIVSLAHAQPLAIMTPTETIYGRPNTEFEGIDLRIEDMGVDDERLITRMRKKFRYKGEIILSHGEPHEVENGVGIKTGQCESYNLVYLGLEIADIEDKNDQVDMMRSSLAWLHREKQHAGVQWLADNQNNPAIETAKILYQFDLSNQSETISTTFNISAEGGWPVEVVSPTIELAPCEIVPMTFTVTVPADLGKNITDTTFIKAVHATDPTISDTVRIDHKTPATVMLVDDHRWYDHSDMYEDAFNQLGVDFDRWSIIGNEKRGSPLPILMQQYEYIVWYTGFDWFLPISPNEVKALEDYLDSGGRLFLNSQDFLSYNLQTDLARNYFGVVDFQDSITPTVIVGGGLLNATSNLTSNLAVSFDRAYHNHADTIFPAERTGVWPALSHDRGVAGVANSSADPEEPWRSLFWSIPFERIDSAGHVDLMASALGWLGDLGESRIEVDNAYTLPGQAQTFTVTVQNRHIGVTQTATITNLLPNGLSYLPNSLVGEADYDGSKGSFRWSGQLTPGEEHIFSYQAIPQTAGERFNRLQISGSADLAPFNRGVLSQAGGSKVTNSWASAKLGQMISGTRPVTLTINLLNDGNTFMSNVTATALIPKELSYVTQTLSHSMGQAEMSKDLKYINWYGSMAPNVNITLSALFTSNQIYLDDYMLTTISFVDGMGAEKYVSLPEFFASKKAIFPFVGLDAKPNEPDIPTLLPPDFPPGIPPPGRPDP